MTIKAMAIQSLEKRWYPMVKAKSYNAMTEILHNVKDIFCIEIVECDMCPLRTEGGCCDGHWNNFEWAINRSNHEVAHQEALEIVKIIKNVRDSN